MEEVAIYGFPVVATLIFARMPLPYALPMTVIAGYLLLPPRYSFDLPMLPAVTKTSMTAFVALFLCLLALSAQRTGPRASSLPGATSLGLSGWVPGPWWARLLAAGLVFGPAVTGMLNGDPIEAQGRVYPGISLYDGLSMTQGAIISLVPFLLARRLLAGDEGHRALLLVLGVAGLLYSLPTVVEIRLSPQLNSWIYGYFSHNWLQHVRGDGYRPVVFLRHALVLSLFLCCALLALLAYMRATSGDRRVLFFAGAAYLGVVLVFSKSLGMILVAGTLAPVIVFGNVRIQMLAAAMIALLVLSYPAMRTAGLNPFAPVLSALEGVSPTRVASLQFRLAQEEALIGHANERVLFGWGEFGRGTAVEEKAKTGSVRDGAWLIRYGELGAVGFVSLFGLLSLPLVGLAARARRYGVTVATSGLSVILAANLLDLIPNSGLTPVTFLLAGALLGRFELAGEARARAADKPDAAMNGEARRARRSSATTDAQVGAPPATSVQPVASKQRLASDTPWGDNRPRPAPATAGAQVRYSRYPARPSPGRGRA